MKIAALGDSITKGVILSADQNYTTTAHSFTEIVGEKLGAQIDNYGKFGSTITFGHHLLKQHSQEIASADYTLLEYGGNDCDFHWKRIAHNPEGEHTAKTTLEEFRTLYIDLIEKVRSLGSRPILLSLPPIGSKSYFSFFCRALDDDNRSNILRWMGGDVERIGRWHDSYNQVVFEVGAQTATPVIDATKPFYGYSKGVDALLCTDGIHPNAEGHRLIADAIMQSGELRIEN